MNAAGKARRSGWSAARVLGVTSENMSITSVRIPAAAAMAASPPILMAMMVASDEARMFTKLFPSRIRPIKRSGRLRMLWALVAPG